MKRRAVPRTATAHAWAFKARFRRQAFGWRGSRLAVTRVREAVGEITKAARKDPALAAEGAVLFLERVSPALEEIDSSSGAIDRVRAHVQGIARRRRNGGPRHSPRRYVGVGSPMGLNVGPR